jgi:hypothetical protein
VLLEAQRNADRVRTLARQEAERMLVTADREVATLERRIAHLRRMEAELSTRVGAGLGSRIG